MECPTCKETLVEVENPVRPEFRHRRGTECIPRGSFADRIEASGIPLVENVYITEGTAVMGEVDWELRADDTLVRVIEPEPLAAVDDYPRLWDSEPDGVTHIAGGCIVIADRFMRQRCEWCGIVLLEYDLKLTAAQGDVWTPPAQWPPGKLIRVDGHVTALIENPQEIDGMVQLPTDCCAFDPKTQVGK